MLILRGCLVCRGDLSLTGRPHTGPHSEAGVADTLVEEFECIQCQREYTRRFEPRRYAAPPVSRGRHNKRQKGSDDEVSQ